MAKYGMSLCTLGWAEEFRKEGIAANSLWPRTLIWTAAAKLIGGDAVRKQSRSPEIMADAAHAILTRNSREFTGNFCIDDVVLHAAGMRDFAQYAAEPGATSFLPDFFVPDDVPKLA
jgi:citronellol/citronellal dehydrogenase